MKEWLQLLWNGYDDIQDLQELFQIGDEELAVLSDVQDEFPFYVNPYYLSLINPADPEDPIRKMCIPAIDEQNRTGSFDTSGERFNTVLPGLQHKYPQTALILATNQCSMYCRFCFRKRLIGMSEAEICRHLGPIMDYIREHTEITNVLISGGDAFMISNDTIHQYLEELCKIEHLDFIRFGTRTPAVLPQRITSDDELMEILHDYAQRKQLYVVTQFNHPLEITKEAIAAVQTLQSFGIPVYNQTVLLKGVNDDGNVLGLLLRGLTSIGVVPYYIFQCRPVAGVMSHFQVPLREGYQIVQEAREMQNGLGKSFRFVLSHACGKIEILGPRKSKGMTFQYHQAKYPTDADRIFSIPISDSQYWL